MSHWKTSSATLKTQQTLLLKTSFPPFLIMLLISLTILITPLFRHKYPCHCFNTSLFHWTFCQSLLHSKKNPIAQKLLQRKWSGLNFFPESGRFRRRGGRQLEFLQNKLIWCQFHKTCHWRFIYSGNIFTAISPATATRDIHYLLALDTLDDATEIGSFLLMSHHPRWPRQICSDCRCCRHYRVTFANVNTA